MKIRPTSFKRSILHSLSILAAFLPAQTRGLAAVSEPEQAIFLPMIVKSGVIPVLVNGDFEQGPSVGWQEYSAKGWVLITPGADLPIPTHSGDWAAWLGGDDDETSRLYQQITLPTINPTLVFWYWIGSDDDCGYDAGNVLVEGEPLMALDLCVGNNSTDWVRVDLDLSAYTGQSVMLEFRVTTDSELNSNLFIDDVSYQGGPAPSADAPFRQAAGTEPKTSR